MFRKFVFVLSLFVLLSCLLYVRVNQAEVNALNSNHVHNINTGINYTTIQEAINAPQTVDEHAIHVDAGIYYEHIVLNKSVSIVGENAETTIIDGNEAGTVVTIEADNVKISNFTIQRSGRTGVNCTGISIASLSHNNIIGYNILRNNFYGIGTIYSENNTFAYNNIFSNNYGITLLSGSKNNIIVGKIVETEAYFGEDDPASHSCNGMTPRNSVMFGPPGFSYVYFIYGNHYLLNVVTEKEGTSGAVLIRASEPVFGIEIMGKNRKAASLKELTNGPGKLTKSFGIDISCNKIDITKGRFFIAYKSETTYEIVSSKRIGINKGKDIKLRYFIKGNPFVSRG